MASMQGPVVCPVVQSKQAGAFNGPHAPILKSFKHTQSGFWGVKVINEVGMFHQSLKRVNTLIKCAFSSSSDGNNSMAGNFNESDEDYVNSSVIEAVEVKSGPDGFLIKMRDGGHLKCVHNKPSSNQSDYAPHPAIVLKMEDGTGLLLPIVVLEMPSVLLMAAVCNVQIARPTMYHVMQEMIEKTGYAVKLVRVTKKVHDAYFAELYLSKVDDEAESISFDLRPSDAINIAVRCKVPIQVNKDLAYNDGMKVTGSLKPEVQNSANDLLHRPKSVPCMAAKEFDLVRNIMIAVVEERYQDAAQYRDKLTELRSKKN